MTCGDVDLCVIVEGHAAATRCTNVTTRWSYPRPSSRSDTIRYGYRPPQRDLLGWVPGCRFSEQAISDLLRTPFRIWALIGHLGTRIWAARYRHKRYLGAGTLLSGWDPERRTARAPAVDPRSHSISLMPLACMSAPTPGHKMGVPAVSEHKRNAPKSRNTPKSRHYRRWVCPAVVAAGGTAFRCN